MVLESTVICVDNTEYMRNGDFLPSRMSAQVDAVSLICHTKNKQHVENTVALLTMGHEVEVVTTLTPDVTKVTTKAHGIQMRSSALQFLSAIRVACLVLKHRQNKNQRQRIVIFVGSPLREEESQLISLAKKLRKEKVAVDVVNFGEDALNTDRLIAFVTALNGGQTQREGSSQSGSAGSHIVTIPSGGAMLNEALLSSPIVIGDDAAAAGGGAASAGGVAAGFEFGVDPNEDPELALALRVSLEEQRARQQEEERRAQQNATASASTNAASSSSAQLASASETPLSGIPNHELTEEEQLQLAIQLSMAGGSGMETDAETQSAATQRPAGTNTQMDTEDADMTEAPADVLDVLSNLSTLDQNDPAVRDAVNQLAGNTQSTKKNNQNDEHKKQ